LSGQSTYQQGVAALQAGELDAACAAFEDVLAGAPRQVGALTFLGVALARRGDFATAEERLRLACELDPVATLPHYNLGRLLQLTDRRDAACECYRTVLRLDRRHAGARRELAALAALDPLLSAPPHGDLAVLEIEPGNAVGHVLALCACLVLPVALAGGLVVAWTGDRDSGSPAVMMALLLGGAPTAAVLCVLAGYPLVARKRAPLVLELEPEGDRLRLRAIDAYAAGRFASAVAFVYAGLFLFLGLPVLMTGLAVLRMGRGASDGSSELPLQLAWGLLGLTATSLVPLAGCSYLGAIGLAGGYNLLAQRLGGVRGRHRYHLRYSEWLAWDIVASWPAVSGTMLLPAVLLGFALALAAASLPLPVRLAAGLLPPLAALLGPPGAMMLYNRVARRLGGVRLALAEE